jgi:hypothetical protein
MLPKQQRWPHLVQVGWGFGRVDTGDDLFRRNQIAIAPHERAHASSKLARNGHPGRLDPAVDADNAPGQERGFVLFPGVAAGPPAADDRRC